MGQQYKDNIGHFHWIHGGGTDRRLREAHFQEHNQEADHLANLGLMGGERSQLREEKLLKNGKRYVVIGTVAKTNGRSGCGVVIKGDDWDKWITSKLPCR